MSAVEHFLVAAMGDRETLPTLTSDEWSRVALQARQHALSLVLMPRLAEASAPLATAAEVRADARAALAIQLQVQADLVRLVPILSATGSPWAVVKGPVLAEHWYAPAARRSYNDLDLVVPPAAFSGVLQALEDAGAELLDRNWTLALQQGRAELSLRLQHGTVLDLHWNLINRPDLRAQFPLDTTELLDRAMTVDVHARPVRTLDAEDTLLHLCLHTTLSGGQRLAWYRDLAAVVRRGVDWQVFRARTLGAGAGLPAAVALGRTRRLLDPDLPAGLEASLAPEGRAWRELLRLLDRLRTPGLPVTSRLSGRLLVEACRQDTPASAAAFRRALSTELFRPILHDPQHPWRHSQRMPRTRPSNPLARTAASPADKTRYLRFVTTGS